MTWYHTTASSTVIELKKGNFASCRKGVPFFQNWIIADFIVGGFDILSPFKIGQ